MLTLAMIFVMLSGNLSAGEHNTGLNPSAATVSYKSTGYTIEALTERPAEEAEINDIPFNTIKIAEQAGYDLRNMLPKEEDINDIPFNTAEIARAHKKLR